MEINDEDLKQLQGILCGFIVECKRDYPIEVSTAKYILSKIDKHIGEKETN